MTAVCAALLLAAVAETQAAAVPAADDSKGAAAKPKITKAAATSQATLPPIAGGSQYSAPNSLPPVSGQLFHLGGLLEVQPLFAFSVGDPFWRTVGAGIRLEQHWDERWSFSGHVIGGLSLLSAPVQVCGGSSCSDPVSGQLRSTPGQLQMLAGAEIGWAPVYGKLSLFGERTLHFDAYVSAGPELVRELIAPDAASAATGRWALGGRIAIGERLFLTDRFMVRVAVSELVYGSRVRGQSEIERKLTIEGGVAWLFGGR
jgi:outer membrane beta-barrel protein